MPDLAAVDLQSDPDIRRVMLWRNDVSTRMNFFHSEPKVWPGYRSEFTGHYSQAPVVPCFIRENGLPLGFLGFRTYAETGGVWGSRSVSIDILIAPDARGRGLGSWALGQVPSLARPAGISSVVGEVKTSNTASVRLFDRSLFARLDAIDKRVADTGETHPVVRYIWKNQ